MIIITQVQTINGTPRANYADIGWAVYGNGVANAPTEEGSGLSTDATGKLTVPSVAKHGIFILTGPASVAGLYRA